jgi:hypothetical protein
MASNADAVPDADEDAYGPRTSPAYGPQVLVFYFGSRTCHFCATAPFKAAMRRVGALLQRQASAAGRAFHFAAVAVDWDAEAGFAYVRELGRFDEVIAGGKWWNTVVGQRLFGPDGAALPTLVIYERTVTPAADAKTLVFAEREVSRLVGRNVIEEWIGRGAPIADLLPPLDAAQASQGT